MKKNGCLKLHLSRKCKQTHIHNTKCDQKLLGLQLLEKFEFWYWSIIYNKPTRCNSGSIVYIKLLKPNDIYIYICRTAALTSRRYILNIYSRNIHTENFKHAA